MTMRNRLVAISVAMLSISGCKQKLATSSVQSVVSDKGNAFGLLPIVAADGLSYGLVKCEKATDASGGVTDPVATMATLERVSYDFTAITTDRDQQITYKQTADGAYQPATGCRLNPKTLLSPQQFLAGLKNARVAEALWLSVRGPVDSTTFGSAFPIFLRQAGVAMTTDLEALDKMFAEYDGKFNPCPPFRVTSSDFACSNSGRSYTYLRAEAEFEGNIEEAARGSGTQTKAGLGLTEGGDDLVSGLSSLFDGGLVAAPESAASSGQDAAADCDPKIAPGKIACVNTAAGQEYYALAGPDAPDDLGSSGLNLQGDEEGSDETEPTQTTVEGIGVSVPEEPDVEDAGAASGEGGEQSDQQGDQQAEQPSMLDAFGLQDADSDEGDFGTESDNDSEDIGTLYSYGSSDSGASGALDGFNLKKKSLKCGKTSKRKKCKCKANPKFKWCKKKKSHSYTTKKNRLKIVKVKKKYTDAVNKSKKGDKEKIKVPTPTSKPNGGEEYGPYLPSPKPGEYGPAMPGSKPEYKPGDVMDI